MKIKIFLILFLCQSALCLSQIGVKGDLSKTVNLGPGDSHRFRFTVINKGEFQVLLDIRPLDFDGVRVLEKPGKVERSLVSWISLNAQMIELDPGQEFELTCWVRVPKLSGLSGSFWGLIGIRETGTGSQTGETLGINVRRRISVLIRVDIGELKGDVEIRNQAVSSGLLSFEIINTGNVIMSPSISLEVQQSILRPSEDRKVYPGQSRLVQIPLIDLIPGDHSGLLIVDCGGSDIWISRITFGFRGGESSRDFRISASVSATGF